MEASGSGGRPGPDPFLRAEIVHSSERTRITRLFLPSHTVIRKEPLGPDGERRVRHEVAVLGRLRGVAGVAQLAEAPRYRGSVVLADAGGASLAGAAKPLPAGELAGLGLGLAGAVAGMHRRGVMHRDITPANVVLSGGGVPCLVDFALAGSFAEIRPEFTHHGEITGTLAYLAPEATGRTGRPVDQRADLYALGAVLYELATGAPPFGAGDPLREAVLGGLEPGRRQVLQLAMARRLAGVPELFAAAAGQYLPAVGAVTDPAERTRVARLLRRAAGQATLTGDYALVDALLTAALAAVDPGETATLAAVHTGRHAALYCLGRLEEADEEYRTIERLCPAVSDRADATALQVRSVTHRTRFPEAVGLGRQALRELGITVPAADRLATELDHQFGYLYQWLDHTDGAGDLARPDLTDPALLGASGLINATSTAAYFAGDPATVAWLGLEALRICREHGPAPALVTPAAYTAFGAVVLRGDYAAGYRAVRRILALSEARGYEPGTSQVRGLFTIFSCWAEPIENSAQVSQRAREGLIAGAGDPLALFMVHLSRANAAAIFGDQAGLERHTAAAMPLVPVLPGLYSTAVICLLRGLAVAGQARGADADQRAALLSELDEVTGWLAARAADAPGNFLHLLRLLQAERAWAAGDFRAAAAAFDAARREAARRQRPWHRALIAEHTARFYLAHGLEHAGHDLLAQARQEYLAWGATAKVDQLDWAYPAPRAPAAASAGDDGQHGDLPPDRAMITTGTIDLLGIVSASQALSSETSIGRLHARVAGVLGAMTGATGVHLLLWDEDRQGWLRPAQDGGTVPASEAGEGRAAPMSVLRYVRRTREPLVVADAAADERFARDPYFAGLTRCSVLAVPIVSRGALRAVLLLGNRLLAGAFTTGRLEAVNLIAGQLAVSLDNAQLYAGYRRIAGEQAALRRVATLVARAAPPQEVFGAVAGEVGGPRLPSSACSTLCSQVPGPLWWPSTPGPTASGAGSRSSA